MGVRFPAGPRIFLFTTASRLGLKQSQHSIKGVCGKSQSSSGIKLATYFHQESKIKKSWDCISTSPYASDVHCVVMHKDNFTCTHEKWYAASMYYIATLGKDAHPQVVAVCVFISFQKYQSDAHASQLHQNLTFYSWLSLLDQTTMFEQEGRQAVRALEWIRNCCVSSHCIWLLAVWYKCVFQSSGAGFEISLISLDVQLSLCGNYNLKWDSV